MQTFAILALVVSGAAVSPVQKVIELCDELKGKVQADLAAEEKLMSEYSSFCDTESNDKTDAITSGKRTIGDLAASIQEASASISTLTSETEELAAKIAAADSDLKGATSIRQKEHGDFSSAETELVDTIDTLSRAIIVLKRGQTSFLQQHGTGELKTLVSSLSKIVEASWVTSSQKSVVQSLLQSAQGSEDEDLSLAPQASTAAYESQGGSILDVLKDMQEKAEEALSSARKDEMSASHAFESLKQSLETELSTMQKRMSAASAEKASNEETEASASSELAATQKSVAADTATLASLKQSCTSKAAEWDARQKSAGEEIGAIDKAKEILSSGVKVFLQVKAKSTTRDDNDSEKRNRVSDLMRSLAVKDHTYALSQLASAAQSDPFGKVRGLIEAMIDRLAKQAAEEAEAKSFCDGEMQKSKAKQASLTAASDKHAARIEKATASKATLAEQTKALQAEIAEMDAGQSEATRLRQAENEEYTKSSKDQKDSAEAVANAIQVLGDYYNKGSFLQVSVKQAPDFNAAKTDVAGTIMEMLEVAESDFTRMLAENEAQESEAQGAYDKLVQSNKASKAAKSEEISGNEGEMKSLEAALLNYKEDHATTSKELDAVLTYLDKLKPQCETKVMTYAERVARREEEIAGLKQALEILGA